jgi:hypothetical protein
MIAGALLSGLKGPQSGTAATSSSQSGASSFASQLQAAMQHSTQSPTQHSMQLGQPMKASGVHHQHGSLQQLLSSFASATNGMSTGSLLASANSIAASATNAAKSIFGQ